MESESYAIDQQSLFKYDVFFSFRGKDTRNNIVQDLYTALLDRGINVYEDNIEAFHQDKETILDAMERSRYVIVVISKNYLRSRGCMDELAKIMETKNARKQIVIPVLYNIDPMKVYYQVGPCGASYHHMSNFKRYNKWRKWLLPLKEVSALAGWNDFSYNKQKSNEEIVDTISRGVSSVQYNNENNLIRMRPHVRHAIKDLLKIGSGGIRMIGICGVGGIGKTTLAMAVYNEISRNFGGRCCFIKNLKEDSRMHGLKKLQEKVLTDVFKAREMTLMSTDEGKRMIKERMGRFSVLIVLDDVDDCSQLEALAGKHSWFGKGSRIIITTRDRCLLEAHQVDSIHQVDLLKDGEAEELFNSYAFPNKKPLDLIREENEKLSLGIVHAAGNLPLTLKVLGSFLCDKMEWTSAMEDIKLASRETSKMLKISYDGLKPEEKEIFLDIALFFRNRKKDEVLGILYACGYQTCGNGVYVLVRKSLISVSNGHFQVHDLIQDLAREIILEDPKEHGRIWQVEQLLKKIEATKVSNIKVIQVRFDDERPVDFSDAFTNMKDLRFLDISISQMSKDRSDDKEPKVLPNNLRWLSWSCYPGKYLPRDFQAKQLVVLCLANSKIVHLSEEHKLLGLIPTLKTLDLSGSKDLISIPSFSGFPNLEKLVLQNCRNLKLIDASIGKLERLVSLDMSCCSKLQAFPPIIGMTSLKFLIFSGCTKLRKFPEIKGNMYSLKHLSLQNSGIQNLPNPIRSISSLVSIDLRDCKSLTGISSEIYELRVLKSLKLSGCSKLEKLPESLGHLIFLEELLLDNTSIRELPGFILNLKSLKTLSFRYLQNN